MGIDIVRPAASATAPPPLVAGVSGRRGGAVVFASAALAVACAAAVLAGWAPVGFSIVTVFLFAGPHNWLEFRYFLSKMPARWGPLRPYFLLAVGGVVV